MSLYFQVLSDWKPLNAICFIFLKDETEKDGTQFMKKSCLVVLTEFIFIIILYSKPINKIYKSKKKSYILLPSKKKKTSGGFQK